MAMPFAGASRSVEEAVYRRLRQEIADMTLPPGQRLRLNELTLRLGVSSTPVRHALRRLEGEGWADSHPHRGASVALLSIDELEETQAVRTGLEMRLARLGAESCTRTALHEMLIFSRDVEEAYARGDLLEYARAYEALRRCCYRCARRPLLMATLDEYLLRASRYVHFLAAMPDVIDLRGRYHDPARLLDACRGHDGGAAEADAHEALTRMFTDFQNVLAASEGSSSVWASVASVRR